MPIDQAEILAQMSGRGAPPPDAQAAPQQPPKAAEKDTDQDKAADKGSPTTEGDKSSADPVIYDIKMGEQTRKMTPEQIAAMTQRYAELNFQSTQQRPVVEAVSQLASEQGWKSLEDVTTGLKSFLKKANEKNPTMGDDGEANRSGEPQGRPATKSAEEISAALKKWEDDNAATLPPGYKEMMEGNGPQLQSMQQQMQQMQRMMQQMLGQVGGTADAARAGMKNAQQQRSEAIKGQIANNIDRVQQALKLPTERGQDFMMFAAERGYTLEDFINPQLTMKVMQDFKNAMDSPEMERMRAMAQRRQAYTGSMGATPGSNAGAGGGGTAQTGNSPLEQMTQQAVAKRTIG